MWWTAEVEYGDAMRDLARDVTRCCAHVDEMGNPCDAVDLVMALLARSRGCGLDGDTVDEDDSTIFGLSSRRQLLSMVRD